MLPYVSDKSIMRPSVRTGFAGINHNLGAGDGELWDTENLSAREFPLLTQRPRRGLVQTVTNPGGLGALDKPWWVSGTGFYYDGVLKGAVTAGEKEFAAMGTRVIIFPDKKVYDSRTDSFDTLGASRSESGLRFKNGTYAGVPADANTVYKAGADWATDFSPGDAVSFSGCATHPENNRSLIVREVEGDELRFYENSFVLDSIWRYAVSEEALPPGMYHFEPGGQFTLRSTLSPGYILTWDGETLTAASGTAGTTIPVSPGSEGEALVFTELSVDYTESGTVTLTREVPDLDYICVNENRLWGCKGDTIYASKPGDPTNFDAFDGLASDSWQSGTVDAGDFTACVSYMGFPIFFKEDSVYKIYGDRPANYEWTPSARLGVKKGCNRSLAVAGETLYYVSRAGVVAYTGGIPALMSDALGMNTQWINAAGGSDAIRYYVSMSDGTAGKWRYTVPAGGLPAGTYHFEQGGQFTLSAAMNEGDTLTWDGTLLIAASGTASAPIPVSPGTSGTELVFTVLSLNYGLYVYDTRFKTWHREDALQAMSFAYWDGGLYMLGADGKLWRIDGARGTKETTLTWRAEFADTVRFYETTDSQSQNKKGLLRLMLRCSLEAGSSLTVWVQYDSDGAWHSLGSLAGPAVKKSYVLPAVLRRCDHFRVKLTGSGESVVYSLAAVDYSGSHLQGGSLA